MTCSHGPIPGIGASISTKRLTRSGCAAAKAYPTMLPDVVRYEIHLLNAECVQHVHDVFALCFLVVTARRLRRESEAAQVGRDNCVSVDERTGYWSPHISCCCKAMEHYDCGPLPSDASVDGNVVCLDVLAIDNLRKGNHAINTFNEIHLRLLD